MPQNTEPPTESPDRDAPLAAVADLPAWLPAPAELDAVEVALLGVPLPIAVAVSAELGERALTEGGVSLTDPEGTPLALLTPDPETSTPDVLAGSVTALQPPEHGPFRALRRSATDVVAAAAADPLVVAVDRPLRRSDVDLLTAVAAARTLVLLPLIGRGSPRIVDAATLVRLTLLVAERLPGATVVPVPLPRAGTPAEDAANRAAVLRAYGGDGRELLDAAPELDAAVDAALASGADLTGVFDEDLAAALTRAWRAPYERGVTVFFTGLSGSGKSTVARAFAEAVQERFGRTVTLLDGDVVRRLLSAGLTFSRSDRELNIRRIGFVAAEVTRHGGLAVCCPIAPYASTRAEVRAMVEEVGEFVLIHISTPLAECERRDRKGLYAKARAGLIPEFTGISDPYEEPVDADLVIDTTDTSVADAVDQVVALLAARGLLAPSS